VASCTTSAHASCQRPRATGLPDRRRAHLSSFPQMLERDALDRPPMVLIANDQ
jgi:hypothetical protein